MEIIKRREDLIRASNIQFDLEKSNKITFNIEVNKPDDLVPQPVRIFNVHCRFFEDKKNTKEYEDISIEKIKNNKVIEYRYVETIPDEFIVGEIGTNKDLSQYNAMSIIVYWEYVK